MFASSDLIAQIGDERAKGGEVGGSASIEDRVRDEFHSQLLGNFAFAGEVQIFIVVGRQQRDKDVNAGFPDQLEIGLQTLIAARTQDDGKPRGVGFFNPEDRLHRPQSMNCSIRSRTFRTWTGRSRRLPSSTMGINLSNSGPECAPVSAMRTG